MFEYAIEAMQAQIQSKFSSELDKLWQKVIDYRDTELRNEGSYRSKYRKLKTFFSENIAQKLMDTVYKFAGLRLSKIAYVDAAYGTSFCTWMFFGNDGYKGTFQIENVLNGGYLQRYWSGMLNIKEVMSAETLLKLAKSYDTLTGSIKPAQRDEIKKIVHSELGFDLGLAFLLADQLPKNSGVENFTPRQITAVTLHEVGHTMTLIEHACDMYAQISSFRYLSEAFTQQNSGNAAEAVKLANLAAAEIEKNNPGVANDIKKLATKFQADFIASGRAASPTIKRSLIGGLITSVVILIEDAICIPYQILFGSQKFKKYAGTSQQKVKIADIPCNERFCTWQERKTDEYVLSHGYGADQVDALAKLSQFFSMYGKTDRQVEKLRRIEMLNKDISIFEKFKLLMFTPLLIEDYGYSLYPAGSKRFKELLNLTIQQLKTNGADPEYVAKYMADIERIIEKIEHADKADEFLAKTLKGYELFLSYCSIPSIADMLIHGHLNKELDRLIDDLQDLSGNLLSYYGFKFSNFAKKD